MKKVQNLLILLVFAAFSMSASFALDVNTVPVLNNAINGDVTIKGNTMNVNTKGTMGTVGQFDWTSFDVGSNKTVNWTFNDHAQTALNRVLGNNMSQIYGKLTSSCAVGGCNYDITSKVILINPNGLMFGNGSTVNLNSFTASTFDAVGARNIKDMSASELATYKANMGSKFGANASIVFKGSATAPGNKIALDNSTWNVSKSAAIVAKDIDVYKGSMISTSKAPNYIDASGKTQSFSNLKLISSNGVEFKYVANGYINNSHTVQDGLAGVDYNIKIGDSASSLATDAGLSSGRVTIQNGGKSLNSDIKIAKSAIKGYKLVENARGDIYIIGNNKVDIDNSSLITYNTTQQGGTAGIIGGTVYVNGAKGTNVQNSTIETAYSTVAKESADPSEKQPYGYSGDVTIGAGTSGDVTIKNSTIISNGNFNAVATNGKLVINSVTANAKNTGATANLKDITLASKTGTDVTNSSLTASQNIKTQATSGDINLVNSNLNAASNMKLLANNTTVDDTALTYKTLNLYEGSNKNNVTIKDASTLNDTDSDLNLDVNGNLTVDNNGLKKTTTTNQNTITAKATGDITVKNNSNVAAASTIDLNAVGNTNILSSTLNSLNGKNSVKAGKALTVTSSNLIAKLNNDLETANDVNVNSNSHLTATADNNVKSTAGNLRIDTSTLTGNNNTVTAFNTAKTYKADISATNNNTVTGKVADIECSDVTGKDNAIASTTGDGIIKDTAVTATNKNTVTANGKQTIQNSVVSAKNNQVTSTTKGIDVTNARLVATVENKLNALGNIEFKYDSTIACPATGCIAPVTKTELDSPKNEVTSGEDVIIGGLVITPKTPKPEDTVTVITAGGDIKTKARVVYDDMNTVYSPADTTGTIVGTGALDTGKTKVFMNTPGNINLVLKNTDNQKAGLDLNGKKVEMIAEDGTLSLSRVIANDLYIDETNKYIAGTTTLSAAEKAVDSYASTNPAKYQDPAEVQAAMAGRGYIKADKFNFDYAPSKVAVSGIYQGSFNEVKDISGTVIGYGKHFIDLDNGSTAGQFVLSYTKPFACNPPPIVIVDKAVDQTALIQLPIQNVSTSNLAAIANNLTDPTVSVIAAAAAINISDDDQNRY